MVIDWLAAGVDPAQATLFIQSRVPEHAELHLLLSMITPLGWLERVPTYKDQQEKLTDRTSRPTASSAIRCCRAADVLIYRAKFVPVGEDQVPHIEFMREIVRRFNHVYGREPGFEEKALGGGRRSSGRARRSSTASCARSSRSRATRRRSSRRGRCSTTRRTCSVADRERLFGYLEGGGRMILVEPRRAAYRGVASCPGSTARRCRSRTATRSACARTPTK